MAMYVRFFMPRSPPVSFATFHSHYRTNVRFSQEVIINSFLKYSFYLEKSAFSILREADLPLQFVYLIIQHCLDMIHFLIGACI